MRTRSVSRSGGMVAGGGALAVGLVVGLAAPAFAHTADASVSQTCVNGTSQSTVQFHNNFDLPATLTYTGAASGSLALPAMVDSTPGTNSVTLAVPAAATLTYGVVWSVGVTQGSRSVPLRPITGCLSSSTTAPTTVPGAAVVTTSTTTAAPSPPPTANVGPTSIAPPADTTPLVAAPTAPETGPTSIRTPVVAGEQLPATGGDPIMVVLAGAALATIGGLLLVARWWPDRG